MSNDDLKNYDTLEKLQTLPWVWIKTAKVFLAVTKDEQVLPVDTHVHRVLNRLWIVNTKTPLQTDKQAEKILSEEDLAKAEHEVIEDYFKLRKYVDIWFEMKSRFDTVTNEKGFDI